MAGREPGSQRGPSRPRRDDDRTPDGKHPLPVQRQRPLLLPARQLRPSVPAHRHHRPRSGRGRSRGLRAVRPLDDTGRVHRHPGRRPRLHLLRQQGEAQRARPPGEQPVPGARGRSLGRRRPPRRRPHPGHAGLPGGRLLLAVPARLPGGVGVPSGHGAPRRPGPVRGAQRRPAIADAAPPGGRGHPPRPGRDDDLRRPRRLVGGLPLPPPREVRLGVPGQAGNVLQYLNYRLDQFLVRAIRTRAEVGVYSVAVGLSESVWWISNAVSLALLPRLTRMAPDRAAEVTPVACRNTLLISAIGAAALAALARGAGKPGFGPDFSDVPDAIALLMPGIVALSGTKVLSSYIFSQGQVVLNSTVAFITLGVTLALDVVLIPAFGVDGAAPASSVAYTASMVLTLYFYRRLSSGGIWQCVLPSPGDAALYAGLAQRVWGRLVPFRCAHREIETS